ncbi:MAG TPA: hypothetical protein VLL97_03645, partial [Acidobacteriota bacterium]|nr:hypothetical protein [Acidobacteriota bacterium]
MAVAYDNAAVASGYNVVTLSRTITIGEGSDRAAVVFLHTIGHDLTTDDFDGSLGGKSLSEILFSYSNLRGMCSFGCVSPASGNQTASLTWETTSASWKFLGVITVSGAAQAGTFENALMGTNGGYNASAASVQITSANGDLAVAGANCGLGDTLDNTEVYNAAAGGMGARGPGTGTTTFTVTAGDSSRRAVQGLNIKQAATLKSITDAGAGSDALGGISVALALTDSGSGVDVFGGMAAAVPVAESGSGADVISRLAAALALHDAGAGSDALARLAAALAVTDSGTGADALSQLAA